MTVAPTLERRVDSLFARHISATGPGCAVGVYRNGAVVLTRGYGLANAEEGRPITPRTTFDLGSASKPFTALAVLSLERRGVLSLDDDVRRWVPEMPEYGAPIRVRDLLQHTSGLRDFQALVPLAGRPVHTMPEFLELLTAQQALNFATGTQHEYSHSDFLLLGLVVERAVGIPFGAYLEREILAPLGMRGSFVDDGSGRVTKDRAFGHERSPAGARVVFPSGRTMGGENLHASVEDLARFDRNFEESIIGGPAVIAQMLSRPQLASGDTIPYAYGLRLGTYRGLRTISRIGHASPMLVVFMRFPDQRFSVATLCNADYLNAPGFAEAVAELYLGDQMRPAAPRQAVPGAVALSPQQLAPYAGFYRSPDLPWNLLRIDVRNGALNEVLFHPVRDDTVLAMTPAGDGRFFEVGLTGNVGIFTFRPAAPGAPRRLDISWNGAPAESLERLADSAVWRPSAAALAEYEGMWFSQELEAMWRLERRGEQLVLRRYGQPDVSVWPVERDQFLRGFGAWSSPLNVHLQFQRDNAGQLTHLTISTPPGEESVRGLRFVRVVRQ